MFFCFFLIQIDENVVQHSNVGLVSPVFRSVCHVICYYLCHVVVLHSFISNNYKSALQELPA